MKREVDTREKLKPKELRQKQSEHHAPDGNRTELNQTDLIHTELIHTELYQAELRQGNEEDILRHMKDTWQDIRLVAAQKEKLIKAMGREVVTSREPAVKRYVNRLEAFWETTYEFNLAGVGAVLATLLLAANIGLSGLSPDPVKKEIGQEPYYLLQAFASPDGSVRIEYIPVYREET